MSGQQHAEEAFILRADGTVFSVRPDGERFRLDEVEEVVGGDFEMIPLADGVVLVVNENGKALGLALNVEATAAYQEHYGADDVVVGDALLCKASAFLRA